MNQNQIWSFPQRWLKIPSEKVLQIGDPRIQYMKDRIDDFSKAEIAAQRMNEIGSIANKISNDTNKILLTIIVTAVGAVTYGSGIKIFAASLGQFTTPATVIGGLLASYGVHALATISLTNYFSSCYSKRANLKLLCLKEQEQENLATQFSELLNVYWDSKIRLISTIEGDYTANEFPLNAFMGLLLSVIEYTCSFAMIYQIAVLSETNLFIKLVAATLPVLITWSASLIQAQKFEIPNRFYSLLGQYNAELLNILPPENLTEEEEDNWYEKRFYDDGRLDAALKIILSENLNQEHPTPELAELAFDTDYYQAQVDLYQELKEIDIQKHKQNFERAMEALRKSSEAKISHKGVAYGERQSRKEQSLQEEKDKLEDKLGQDLMKMMNMWEKKIIQFQGLVNSSKNYYEKEYAAWESRNPVTSQ